LNISQLIICLNRPTGQDPHERQRQAINAKGVHISAEAWAKVEVLASTIGAPFLGLPLVEYWRLCGQVTHIIHAAWPMDFKRTVSSFEVQFQQLSHLLELARNVHLSQPHIIPKFQFVSSISVVGKYPEVFDQRTVPEIPMQDGRSTLLFGYGEAKFVCEKMIEKASSSPQLNAIIVRVGQMSGAQATGYWNFQEHFPALVKSSKKIGALPVLGGVSAMDDDLSELSGLQADHFCRQLRGCQSTMRPQY
jgi:thioester reductase-like protein